jgi:putative spermidine/putrescine transport system ATP-binding protein
MKGRNVTTLAARFGALLDSRVSAQKQSTQVGSFVQLRGLCRSYGAVVALHHVDLDINAGEFLTLLGPSGSGKTTILNLIAGFDFPTSGTIVIGNRDVTWQPPYSRDVGMVFQNYALFPHMSVFENVAFPLRSRRLSSSRIKTAVNDALELVQLGGIAQRLPRELSGGQQQRVALARAFVYRPSLLLMDEPLAALDRKLRAELQIEIKRIHRDVGTTVVYVTHDQDEALSMSDRIAVLHHGKLQQCASPDEIYAHPATRFVAGFVGEANFLSATVVDSNAVRLDDFAAHIPIGGGLRNTQAGTRVIVCMRPENFKVVLPDQGIRARLQEVLFLGDTIKCLAKIGDTTITINVPPSDRALIPEIKQDIGLLLDGTDCTIFNDTSSPFNRAG